MTQRQSMDGRWTWFAAAWIAGGVVAMFTLVGCDASKPAGPAADGAVRSDVTDIRPLPPAPAVPQAAAVITCTAPLVDASGMIPVAPQAVVPASATEEPTAAVAPAPRTHVVRRGETLFAIAKASYGDGKQWPRLAVANPAAAGKALRVGQEIVVP